MCIWCPHAFKRGPCKCRYMAPHSASHRLLGTRYQALGLCYGLMATGWWLQRRLQRGPLALGFSGAAIQPQVSSTRVCWLCSFCRAAKAAWPHSQLLHSRRKLSQTLASPQFALRPLTASSPVDNWYPAISCRRILIVSPGSFIHL